LVTGAAEKRQRSRHLDILSAGGHPANSRLTGKKASGGKGRRSG
jgi:hypothetical protein